MASFVVMEPSSSDRDPVFVRDGFHVFAFLVPVVWLLFHRLWIEAGVALLVMLLLGAVGSQLGFAGAPLLSLLVSIYVGLEGAAIRIAALRRRDWREWGVVDARNREEAELRYLDHQEDPPEDQLAPAAQPWGLPSRVPAGPALGLFSYPGRG